MTARLSSRRSFLHAAGMLSGSALLFRCAPRGSRRRNPLRRSMLPGAKGMMGPDDVVALVYNALR